MGSSPVRSCGATLVVTAASILLLSGCAGRRAHSPAPAADDASAATANQVITRENVGDLVAVKNVRATDQKVTGTIVNHTPRTLRDVQLMIQHTFLWNNERHPGTDNPGRSEYFLVLEDVPPDGKVSFEYRPDPPLPKRADGYFETRVEVIAFTEIGG